MELDDEMTCDSIRIEKKRISNALHDIGMTVHRWTARKRIAAPKEMIKIVEDVRKAATKLDELAKLIETYKDKEDEED